MDLERRPQPVILDSIEMEADAAATFDGKMDQKTFADLIVNTAKQDPAAFATMQNLTLRDFNNDTSIPGAYIDVNKDGHLTGITFEMRDSSKPHDPNKSMTVGLSLSSDASATIESIDKNSSKMEHPDVFMQRHPGHKIS